MMHPDSVVLEVRQQPIKAQVVPESSTKPRKPIDPPPVIELKYDGRNDSYNKEWLVSPRAFMKVELYQVNEDRSVPALVGQLTSSLFKLKERSSADKEGGYFIFGDISVQKTGTYKLRFHLIDTAPSSSNSDDGGCAELLASIDSSPFEVQNSKEFGSMSESTDLTKSFADQGVKLRVRKHDPRTSSGRKRGPPSPDESPNRHSMYNDTICGENASHTSGSYPSTAKRLRAESDYSGNYYVPGADSPQYQSTTGRSSASPWVAGGIGYHSRGHSYSQQAAPALSYASVRGHMSNSSVWQQPSMHSALPSPASSTTVGHHQASPTYRTGGAITSAGLSNQTGNSQSTFGDSTLNQMPLSSSRNAYQTSGNSNTTGAHAPYMTSNSQYSTGVVPGTFTDMHLPVTSLSDASSLVAPDPAYAQGPYHLGNEVSEESAAYTSYSYM